MKLLYKNPAVALQEYTCGSLYTHRGLFGVFEICPFTMAHLFTMSMLY